MKKLLCSIILLSLITSPLYAVSTATTCDTDCVLLIHGDGSDASTTFTDSSSGAKTVTANGNVQVDTAQSKFGGASVLFDGTGDYLSIADSADWDLGTGDFTWDFWIQFNDLASYRGILSRNVDSDFSFRWRGTGNSVQVFLENNLFFDSVSVALLTVWYHVAVTRSGTNLRLFINGTQVGSTATSSNDVQGTAALQIGSGTQTDFNGWIDEMRIVKGTAVWTADFTPPSAQYELTAAKRLALLGVGQ